MQETTYPIHDILTENEQLPVLRLINALNQWLENDDSSSLLVSACSGILSGSITRKDLTTALACLMLWQQFHARLPKARQDQALSARIMLIADKLRQLCTTPAA